MLSKITRRFGIWLLGFLIFLSLAACSPSQLASLLATPTPSHTPTLTPTLTPTPAPTPRPVVRVQEGDHALFNGDWNQAIALYQTALDGQPDPAVAAAARFGLAASHMRAGNLDTAAGEFAFYLQAYP